MRRVAPSVYTRKYYTGDCSGYKEYEKSWGRILESRFKEIVKETPSVKGKKILDVGCGRGELVFWLAKNGAKESIGIDYSTNAIYFANKAKKRYSKKIQDGVGFEIMDAKNLKFADRYFDGVLFVETLEHLYPEEQELVLKEIFRVLKHNGFVLVHTAPNKIFNDLTYRFWCYPLSTVIVGVYNLLTKNNYGNLDSPTKIRTYSHKVMHVGEPTYFSLKLLFNKAGFKGKVRSTNVTVNKPEISWKDKFFNTLVYLYPLSKYFPFNIFWGNDFICVLTKR